MTCIKRKVCLFFFRIIFKDPIYKPWLGQLAKLVRTPARCYCTTAYQSLYWLAADVCCLLMQVCLSSYLLCLQGFFASGVHQTVFAIMSTLPYAIGQVQDVGLIFLSAMATSIAALCSDSAEVALGTALTWLAISTILVGTAIVAVGKYKWATLVQYMPVRLPCLLPTRIVFVSITKHATAESRLLDIALCLYFRSQNQTRRIVSILMYGGDVGSEKPLTYISLQLPYSRRSRQDLTSYKHCWYLVHTLNLCESEFSSSFCDHSTLPTSPGMCHWYVQIQVVGAYLGYVGYFCIAAGIGLGVSEDIGSISSCENHRPSCF